MPLPRWREGASGGVFIPLVVEGALLGRLLGGLFGGATPLYPMLGVAAFLGAGYRTPLAAVIFVAEATGRAGFVVPGLIAAVVSQLVMGKRSVALDQLPSRSGNLEARLQLPVSTAVSTDAPTVAPETTADEFVREHVVAQHIFVAPVVDAAGQLAGVVDLADIEELPRERWSTTPVAELMHATSPGQLSWSLREAVAAMGAAEVDALPIVDDTGRYAGLLTIEVVIALSDLLGGNDEYGPPKND
ncbi:MAG: CBS domain-containing protein [Actinomycetota bacterium]